MYREPPLARGCQPLVSEPVVLERFAIRVEGEAVELDDEPLVRPAQVNLSALDSGVRARSWQLRGCYQFEQLALVLRAGQAWRTGLCQERSEVRYAFGARGAGNSFTHLLVG